MPTLQYPVLMLFDSEVEYFLSEENVVLTKNTIQNELIINQQIIDSDFNIFIVKGIRDVQKLPKKFWPDLFNPLYKVDLDIYFYKKTTIESVRKIANDYISDFLGTGEIGKSVCHSFMQELDQAISIQKIIQIMFDETV